MCFLTPSCFSHWLFWRPQPSFIGSDKASVLTVQRVRKVPEVEWSGHLLQIPMFPRRETEAASGEVPSHRPPMEGVAELEAPALRAVLMARALFQDPGGSGRQWVESQLQ